MLRLEYNDPLEKHHSMNVLKRLRDGELKECPDPQWREETEHILIESQVSDLHRRKSLEAQRLAKLKQEIE